MRRALEASRPSPHVVPYGLDQDLPFAFLFAKRKQIIPMSQRAEWATQSDGATSGNDGSNGSDSEDFDWLDDD